MGNDPNFATTMTNALAGKQPLDATLTALAALATGANKLPYFTGKDTVAQTDLTSVGRDILAKTSTLAVIQYLGLRELGTSGEKIPLLSTANTWSARQTFSAGITGTLTGNADTATKLKTARKINGVAFDGSADITLTPEDLGLTDIASQAGNAVQRSGDTMGGQLKIGTINALRIFNQAFGLIFRRSEECLHLIPTNEGEGENGNIGPLRPFSINLRTGLVSIGNGVKVGGGITGNLTGNADTATKLKTARTIGGVSFDGSANIDLPGVNKTGNQSTTGNAATATKLQTARTIGGVSFDGSANIDLPGVNKAGNQSTTGNAATATKLQTARTINGVKFDGSANITLTAANLGLSDSSGYVGRLVNTRVFTSSGTYTPTPGTKRIRVTITGGGGGGGGCQATSNNETFFGAGGGAGGTIISIMTPTQNSYPVTIGAGGGGGVGATNGLKGGDSSFGTVIAPGGEGGGKVGVTNTNGGNGGAPNTGDVRIIGGHGGDGQSGNISVSGEGGSSFWGGGGRAGAGGGVIGRAYGSGGGGAYDAGYSGTSMTGGKGAAGICIIEEFA
ncbi:phage tail protein [Escherichia coli]